ncbi:ABC transporter permease [Anaerobium acetethylicum]|uniref:Ribose transport system permease protein n=1 Tax=Anaerobium acetethylicum TaxID=1619234 RepID=A0A1D3TYD1_9FIRM|nr:ABC transporter permease [Anaerobium acetethylicum]SCP99473.1 ribose transport system permease protein [Anaerobium acetethylicum]
MIKGKKVVSQSFFPSLLLLVIFFAIMGVMNHGLTLSFVKSLILTNTPALCLAIGVTVTILVGGTDISLGSIVSLVNVVIITLAGLGYSITISALIGLLVAVICGVFNGIVIGIMRVNPLLTTFATSTIYAGIALWILPNPGGSIDYAFAKWYMGGLFGFIMTPVMLLILLVFIWAGAIRTPFGLKAYALGCNEKKAYASGINVNGIRVLVHTFAGLTAGVAGICLTATICSGSPTVGATMSLNSIAAAVIGGVSLNGGKGGIFGAILGAGFLSILSSIVVAANFSSYSQSFIKGLILLIGVIASILAGDKVLKDKIKGIFCKGGAKS